MNIQCIHTYPVRHHRQPTATFRQFTNPEDVCNWIRIVRAAGSKYQQACSGGMPDPRMATRRGVSPATRSGTSTPAMMLLRSMRSISSVSPQKHAAERIINNPWTADEDQFLMAPDGLTTREKAQQLGRTYAACARRRHILKGRQQP